ncbi:MAG TPA: aminotransferase class III-fold pyridoxal phosphate-dependent enzyme [Acetobacteraceae bacterium]|jgi:glutamate-1-semialdehyde 2,1-aminomutase|nr:aminotransferase class III-fold pyridoxal phosphate-dependent enzyme [Acetobacteraceae bacterium]
MTNSRIVAAYRERTPGSADLAHTAASLFPSGITHDARHLDPYGIYVARAQGPHKWDVDGNRYIDFFGGHGALLLGHRDPVVTAAVETAMTAGTHFGASHPGEVAWAQAVQRLVPAAERIRFTSSGTEATLMALRLARAHTGRSGLIRLRGHFHGWHDHMTSGYTNHFDGSATPGVLAGITDRSVLVDPGDIGQVRAALAADGDIAALILEPTGSSFGQVPLRPEYLHALRSLTEAHGVLLIFDEVVTGFRVSRGGAQVAFGIRPDLSSWAKILAGGLPGGAVTGRRDILDLLDFDAARAAGREKIQHPGTFNANPVSAASGTAALGVIAETDACARADATAAALRAALNETFAREGVPWAAYGTSSGFHLFLNPHGRPFDPAHFDPLAIAFTELKTQPEAMARKLRLALLVQGVDVNGRIGGLLSCTHTEADVAETASAFAEAIRMLRQEGETLH